MEEDYYMAITRLDFG